MKAPVLVILTPRWYFGGPLFALPFIVLGLAPANSQSIDFSSRELEQGLALERAINAQRVRVGMPALKPLNQDLQRLQLSYSAAVLNELLDGANCDHDYSAFQTLQNQVSKAPAKIATAFPASEVIGCPINSRSWSTQSMMSRWEQSPRHNQILFKRPNRSKIGCSVRSRGGFVASICTLWTPYD
jgi:hypothetical protein